MKPISGKFRGFAIMMIGGAIAWFFNAVAQERNALNLGLLVLIVIGSIIFVIGFLISIIYWMCPSCGRFLPYGTWRITYCPHCAKEIDKPRFGSREYSIGGTVASTFNDSLPKVTCENCNKQHDFDYHTCPHCNHKR